MSQKYIKHKFLIRNEKDSIKCSKKESESLIEAYIIQKNTIKNKTKKTNNNFFYKNIFFINIFLFQTLLLLLNKEVFCLITSNNYINLKVADKGEQQIFSDKYIFGIKYSRIYVNERVSILRDNNIVSLDKADSTIRIEWDQTISDFTHMFENINSITSVTIKNLLNSSFTNISYMFYNCQNLKTVSFEGNNNIQIVDAIKMFYNCKRLGSVSFNMIYETNNLNVSEMFYNCYNLTNVYFNSSMNINNMTKMFYNCYSLSSVDSLILKNQDNYLIDMSYSFYNCQHLNKFELKLDGTNKIISNDVRYMFYNCNNLTCVNINNLKFNQTTDMAYLFYNCQKLSSIDWNNDIDNLINSNMQSMFYNCSTISSITLPFKNDNTNINMARMFYNCISLGSISFQGSSTFHPNDMHEMFYNCKSLINFNNFFDSIITDITSDMSFLFCNCEQLSSLELKFDNTITRNMRGMFMNCFRLNTLILQNFKTNNVEIMWEMFKNCKSLTNLNLSSFDTSKVTDMESMFEGCGNIISLDLSNFETSNVQYMNKMFKNCYALKDLNFKKIKATSVGTMHQMFYNCKSLDSLNIFSLTENGQTIAEMFDGTSPDFKFCVEESEKIPSIFEMLLYKENTTRDCSEDCYGQGHKRVNISEKKLCCRNVSYNGSCYEKCPGKTQVKSEIKECEPFNCTDSEEYFDYDQNNCTKDIRGYYVNSSDERTIDKCHEDCLECKMKWTINSTKCTKCKEPKKYIYLGNCYEDCTPGFYQDDNDNNEKCKCFDKKCELCSEDSLEHGLCETCNDYYYPKEDDKIINDSWKNCYHEPERYYIKDTTASDSKYKRCYTSCKYCFGEGNHTFHNCINCTDDEPFAIQVKNKEGIYNCFQNCSYYYYFDYNYTYKCTLEQKCPANYSKLINGERECIQNCTNLDIKKYEYQGQCYDHCPEESYNKTKEDYFCRITCPFDRPFEMVQLQTCVNNCTIMERHYNICKTNFEGNKTSNALVQDKLFNNLQDDIIETFDFHYVNDQRSIILFETDNTYEIFRTDLTVHDPSTSKLILSKECKESLRKYYGIANDSDPFYILKLDAHREGMQNPKVEYQVYYSFNQIRLEQLDLTVCEGTGVSLFFKANLTGNEDLYNKNSGYYNDICYTYTSDDGTDIPLEIRQQLYADNNQSLCEEGCDFSSYDYVTREVECDCDVKITTSLVSEIEIDKESLYNFVDITKLINFDVMKCVDLFFDAQRIVGNIGFFVFIPTFVMLFVCIIVFYVREFSLIKKQINEIVEAKKNYDYILHSGQQLNYYPVYLDYLKEKGAKLSSDLKNRSILNFKPTINKRPPTYKVKNKIMIKIKKRKKKNSTIRETNEPKTNTIVQTQVNDNIENNIDKPNINNKLNQQKNDLIYEETKDKKEEHLNNTNNKNAPPKKQDLIDNETTNNNVDYTAKKNIMDTSSEQKKEEDIDNDFYAEKVDQFKGKFSNKEKSDIKDVLKYNDNELNSMSYNEAIRNDHRTFFQFYFSLLKTKHLLITIINSRDYNSRIVKIYLFFFNFASGYAINGLFFDDDSMHKIYQQKGEFNFIQQIPQILYSNIIGYFFDIILSYLSLSEDDVINLKQEKEIKNIDKKKDETISTLKIKFIFFFIISFLFLVLFWYYIGCFCAVYNNTQIHLFKDTLIGFASSMGYPFVVNLFPAMFRIPALKRKTKTHELMFICSKIIQFF